MRLPRFDYASPASAEEAVRLLSQAGGKAKILCGGTDLLPALKRGSKTADLLVNIKEIPALQKMEETGDGRVVIGAAVGLGRLQSLSRRQAVVQAASRVAAAELNNMGTIGGNILVDNRCWYCNRSRDWWRGKAPCFKRGGSRCYVFPSGRQCRAAASSDLAPALVAAGVKAEIVSPAGSRLLPLEDLYQADGTRPHRLTGEEVVTCFHFPPLPRGSGSSFNKVAKRQTLDFALVNAAARIRLDADGTTCKEASATVSGSVTFPTVLPLDPLVGQKITPAVLQEAADDAVKHIGFITHAAALDVPANYRRRVAGVLLRQCLVQAWEKAASEVG
ncbi:MAG: FAD binding domain-containing protein [Desulfobacterales bacterium]|nr:FAD binding domain-containing protein [Desulfobacterales bacterium]